MAFTALATVTDLSNRGIDTTRALAVTAFLAAAESEVRNAAGAPITQETFTVAVEGSSEQWLRLPGQPVSSVSSVLLDGAAVSDWKLVGGNLWRRNGWLAKWWEPNEVTVALTGGLPTAPEDITDLVCSMVGLALAESESGDYASRGDVVAVRIDDASEQYDAGATGKLAGVMELPEATRQRLRTRFGGGAAVVSFR